MTRLFDALRKGERPRSAARPHLAAAPAPLPLAAVPPIRTAVEIPPAAADEHRRRVVPFRVPTELPADVAREMTTLRVSLEGALTERIPRTVMLLASQGGEGTSTVAAQFAQFLAGDSRLRVLLADAHARRPAYGAGGASSLPWWRRTLSGSPADAAENLDLLPVPESARLEQVLLPDTMRGILAAVGSGYDWIVIDGPAVLESPDAAPLATAVDGVLIVAQAGRTKRPVLARSVDLVRRGGGRVLGIVLNRRRLEIPEFIYRRI